MSLLEAKGLAKEYKKRRVVNSRTMFINREIASEFDARTYYKASVT